MRNIEWVVQMNPTKDWYNQYLHQSVNQMKTKHQTDFVQDSDIIEASSINDEFGEVKRDLKARHVSMIAIGGTIGTGLFISTGSLLHTTGPVMSLISFLFVTTICFPSLNLLVKWLLISLFLVHLLNSSLVGSPRVVVLGWLYWFSWAVTFGLELSVVGQVIQFWTDAVPLAAWISIFSLF